MHFNCLSSAIFILFVELSHAFYTRNGNFARYATTLYIRDNWVVRPGEEVINISFESTKAAFNRREEPPQKPSIAELSLSEINKIHGFSIHYLGDFVCTLGLKPPIRIKEKIEKFLSEEQIFTLLRAIMSLESGDASAVYDTQKSLDELAKLHRIPVKNILKICVQEKINIPFGPYTRIHSNEMNRLNNRLRADYPNIDVADNDIV